MLKFRFRTMVNISILSIVLILVGCSETHMGGTHNDHGPSATLFANGAILTMAGDAPEYAEAVVAESGKIVFVGDKKDAIDKFPNAQLHDLAGNTLLPGFVDPHSHFSMVINAIGQANVSPPPVGKVESVGDLISELNAYKTSFDIPDGEWIFAWGYDESQLADKQHITKHVLDEAFPNNPVYLQHTSGHLGIANSMALALGGIDEITPDPEGGKIIRFDGSDEPTGQVQEVAIYFFAGKAIQDFIPKKKALFPRAQNYYLGYGVTTAQDGMTDPLNMQFFQEMASSGELVMDLVTVHGMDIMLSNNLTFGEYNNRLKPQGVKLIADGSPQGKTAFFTKPYLTDVDGCERDCVGYPHMNQENLDALMLRGYKNGFQMFIHGNGDASIDMIIKAHERASAALNEPLDKDRRTVVIHSQFVRPDQLKIYQDYNLMPSFFTNHAYFFGDVHVENLGEQRAHFLSPMKAASELGLVYSNHSDETVTPINPLFSVHTAVNRQTRSGAVLGYEQKVSAYDALKAVTINAAHQIFDEQIKGTIEVGKYADFAVLDADPVSIAPEAIEHIQVLTTIKNGEVVFQRPSS